MAQIVGHADPRLRFEGHCSLDRTADYTQPWRIPFEQVGLFPHVDLRAQMPAGVRLVFQTDSTSIAGSIAPPDEPDICPIDLVIDGQFVASHALKKVDRFEFAGLSDRPKRVELWLPHFGVFRLCQLRIDDDATLEAVDPDPRRKRWITYGSSITHAPQANHPTACWPARVARECGFDLINLGLSGQCHLDGMVARLIRDTPADLISACLGINMHGGSVGQRAFVPAVINLVRTVREKHPTTPFVLISPICSPPRETEPSLAGWTLPLMRLHLRDAFERLRAAGDEHLYLVNGLDLFGPADVALMPDLLHPNHEAQPLIARRFIERVVRPHFRGV